MSAVTVENTGNILRKKKSVSGLLGSFKCVLHPRSLKQIHLNQNISLKRPENENVLECNGHAGQGEHFWICGGVLGCFRPVTLPGNYYNAPLAKKKKNNK